MNTDFVSELGPNIVKFLEFKHALGIQYKSATCYLRSLDRYNYSHGNSSELTKEITEGWAIAQSGKSITSDRSWVSPIREFGRYLRSAGHDDAFILDAKYKIQRYHAEVYLMSENEIQSFFNNCDSYVLKRNYLGRPYVLPAIYRLLYCCGVRCGEARKLKCENVHLEESFIDIIQSKAHCDRRLFLSMEITEYLKKYDHAISRCFPAREYFFPSVHGGMYSSSSLSVNFKNIWIAAGLNRDGKVKPRAYDFRHHFACANIMRWSIEGKNIHAMLPYLMRYMGHSTLESTYYYIHLIPDFSPQYITLTSSMEEFIPEVEEYEV
jgi:integrase/recombinase XerD